VKDKRVLEQDSPASFHRVVTLYRDKKKRNFLLHRLVAKAFCEVSHPDHVIVNHIDGNRRNNRAVNLEWTTQSGNVKHAWRTGLFRARKPRPILRPDNLPGEEWKEYKPNFLVSNLGRFQNTKRGRLLVPSERQGYLYLNVAGRTMAAHRVVAE